MYSAQVGGHPGVTSTEDGSLLIKPAIHHELEFYHALQHNPALASLRDFTPKFLGTLNLEGKIDQDQEIHPVDSVQKDISFFLIVSFLSLIVICTVHRIGEPLLSIPPTQHPRYQTGHSPLRLSRTA